MTSNRPQNSILVLATIGVYLGLVLAGATPQILAQAATTRQFDVKDEIEVKDDLDRKPKDTSDPLVQSIDTYFEDLEKYLRDSIEADAYLHSVFDSRDTRFDGRYVGVYRTNPEPVLTASCYRVGNAQRLFDSTKVGYVTTVPILLNPHYEDVNWSWGPMACNPIDGSEREKANFTEIEVFGSQKGDFKYQLSAKLSSTQQASDLFDALRQAVRSLDVSGFSERQKVLWQNTKLTIIEDKILIVTSLPRGSLDTLLATNAK